jgi:hypothetical protein
VAERARHFRNQLLREASVATARTKRLKAAAVAGAVTLLAATGVLIGGGSPAGADVNSASGSAFGAFVSVAGLTVINQTGQASGSATLPATGYPLDTGSLLPVSIPGVLSIGVSNAGTQASGLGTHEGTVISNATVASVVVGPSAITLDAVTSSCTANGDGATGTTELVGATAGGNPLITSPLANTVIDVPGIATITLNEQTPFPDPHTPGVEDLEVNGAHIEVLPGVAGLAAVDIILAHSECHVAGPDVNQVTTTSTTGGGGSTTSNTGGGGSSTTSGGGGSSTTTGGDGSTTTTIAGFSSVTTIAGTPGGSIVAGVLARTGAFLSNAIVWAILVVFLGGIALLGSRGEVQTWPPKRSASRSGGPKRSGTSWPKNKPGSSKRRFF